MLTGSGIPYFVWFIKKDERDKNDTNKYISFNVIPLKADNLDRMSVIVEMKTVRNNLLKNKTKT